MTNHAAGRDLLEFARRVLETNMRGMRASATHNGVVRAAQEAFELCLKAGIRELGHDYPKVHDPAAGFVAAALACGVAITTEEARRLLEESKWLADNRGPAFYHERVYGIEESERAAAAAEWAFELVERRVFRAE
jgi:HEPN domain-containing protein